MKYLGRFILNVLEALRQHQSVRAASVAIYMATFAVKTKTPQDFRQAINISQRKKTMITTSAARLM